MNPVSAHKITRLTFEWSTTDKKGRQEAEDYIAEHYDDTLTILRSGLKPMGDGNLNPYIMQWVVDVLEFTTEYL